MKQFRVLSLLSIFCLLMVGCFGVSMLAYQQSYQTFSQVAFNQVGSNQGHSTIAKLTPTEQKEYVAELNSIYLRNQFI